MYFLRDIQRIGKVPKDKLQYWIRLKIIEPYVDQKGRGKQREFSHQNLIEAMVCRDLSSLHVDPTVMGHAIGMLNTHTWKINGKKYCFMKETLKNSKLVPEKKPFLIIVMQRYQNVYVPGYYIENEDKLTGYLSNYTGVIVVNLARIVEEANKR